MDTESRRWCQQCRLRKCFQVGMKKELIQKGKRPVEEAHGSEKDLSVESRSSLSPPVSPSKIPGLVLLTPQKRARKRIKKEIVMTVPVSPPPLSPEVAEPTKNLPVELGSPTPSLVESCSSFNSSSEFGSLQVELEMLSGFERDKLFELIKANEVMNESNRDDEGTAGKEFVAIL